MRDRQAGRHAARRRRDLQQHPEAQVDQAPPGGGGRHGARRRDDGDQADCRSGLEVDSVVRVEERNEEDAAVIAHIVGFHRSGGGCGCRAGGS